MSDAAARNRGRAEHAAREAARVSGREQRILGIIETARSKQPKFKDERITMAHGAGGKATQTLIEGLFVPGFGSEPSPRWATRASRSRSSRTPAIPDAKRSGRLGCR